MGQRPKMNIITEGKLKAGMAFIKLAQKYGAKLVRSKKHNIFRDAAGHQITAPKTTSDFRAIKNFESELRNRGFIKQETVGKVKDALVKGSKETVLPASRRTPPAGRSASAANQQTTFKTFTQKYQPNVQGPRKPNTQPKVRVQGPESELAHRHKKAFDNRLDELIKSVRETRVKPLSDAEMAKLRRLNLTPSQKKKFRELGLLPEGYKDPRKRELKLKGQKIIKDQEIYDQGTTPVRLKKV